jgi:hypothetical protein
MSAIIIESALFIAALAMLGALAFSALKHFTPLGLRLRQTANRLRIERQEALSCPQHGPHDEQALVRLPGGVTMCPECYKETMHGKLF